MIQEWVSLWSWYADAAAAVKAETASAHSPRSAAARPFSRAACRSSPGVGGSLRGAADTIPDEPEHHVSSTHGMMRNAVQMVLTLRSLRDYRVHCIKGEWPPHTMASVDHQTALRLWPATPTTTVPFPPATRRGSRNAQEPHAACGSSAAPFPHTSIQIKIFQNFLRNRGSDLCSNDVLVNVLSLFQPAKLAHLLKYTSFKLC